MSIGRDSLAYWASQAANFFASFVTSIFVARILGPENRGLVTGVLLANTTLVSLTNLGLQPMAMYFIGKAPGELARRHTALAAIIAAICVADAAFLALAGEAARRQVFAEISWPHLAAALAALPFSLYFLAAQGVASALGRVRELSGFLFKYSLVVNALNIAALLFVPWKVAALLAIWGGSQVAAAGFVYAIVRRSGQPWARMSMGEIGAEARQMLSYGARAFAGSFSAFLINRNDHFFISSALGNMGLGVYNLSARVAELVYHPSAALENAGYRQVASQERASAARLVQDLFRTNFFVNGLAVAALVLLAHPLVLIAYGSDFAETVLPLRILLPGTLLLSGSRILALYFSAQLGKPQIPSAIGWMTLAVNAPLMWWVVAERKAGLAGAAAATTGSYALMLAAFMICFAASTGLANPAAYFIPQARDFERVKKLWQGLRGQGG